MDRHRRKHEASEIIDLLGLPFEALVFVTMHAGDRQAVASFEKAIAQIPNVVQAHRLFGEPDYRLFVPVESKQQFQEHYDQRLSLLPGVQCLTSTLVMKTVVDHHAPI